MCAAFKIEAVREALRLPALVVTPGTTSSGIPLPGKPVETFTHRPTRKAGKGLS